MEHRDSAVEPRIIFLILKHDHIIGDECVHIWERQPIWRATCRRFSPEINILTSKMALLRYWDCGRARYMFCFRKVLTFVLSYTYLRTMISNSTNDIFADTFDMLRAFVLGDVVSWLRFSKLKL